LALIAASGFDTAFTVFHLIFFNNDLWLLDAGDRLLTTVPTEFFISIFIYIVLLAVSFMAVMLAAGALLYRKLRSKP
jgi:integral membrane protein (TIGR01906 family)